jgi:ATP-dependent Zn protease
MKTSLFYRWFLISLFFISCPSIFAESSENGAETELQFDKETFDELMTVSRKHTQEIGWCCQQINQTLCNNKEQYAIKDKKQVIAALTMVQEFTQDIDLVVCSKNTRFALMHAINLNKELIHFLSQALTSRFQDFDIQAFLEKTEQSPISNPSNEAIIASVKTNDEDLKKLLDEIGTTGLTWYNLLHRKMKDLNVYDITKKTLVFGVGLTFLATIYCASGRIKPDGGWFDRWIGTAPIKNPLTGKYEYETGVQLGSKNADSSIIDCLDSKEIAEHFATAIDTIRNPQSASAKDLTEAKDFISATPNALLGKKTTTSNTPFTVFQSTIKTLQSLHDHGMASIAPLFTVNLAGISHYCFGDSWSWAKNKYNDNTSDLDKFLNGSQPIKNLNPDGQEKVYFQDLVGCQELEALAQQLANCVEHPEYLERSKTESHRGILLYGPPQTGKSNFAKALRTLIQDRLESAQSSKKVGFIDGKALLDSKQFTLEELFYIASRMAPCILFFDEIDLIGGNREKSIENTGILLSKMQGIDSSKQVIVIGATNRIEELDKALLVDGRFGKQFFIDYPEYKYRKQFLESELAKRAISLSDDFIDHMAQETDGCSYNNLRRIITEAIIISGNERRLVCQADFDKTLDTEIRKIHFGSRNKSCQEEKEIIAVYQAGKALMRHLLRTDKQTVKVTIEDVSRTVKPKTTGYAISLGKDTASDNERLAAEQNETKIKLGEVFTTSKNNKKDFMSDQELKKECLVLLAGNIAQQIVLGQTYSQCNKHDRADAIQIINQGLAQGEKIDDKIRAQALVIKDAYEQEIMEILKNNQELLFRIFDALAEHTTIDRYQWAELIS